MKKVLLGLVFLAVCVTDVNATTLEVVARTFKECEQLSLAALEARIKAPDEQYVMKKIDEFCPGAALMSIKERSECQRGVLINLAIRYIPLSYREGAIRTDCGHMVE